jgi:GrpB-like predicted nucleotidyltransferase (UPF0157 family)
MNPRGARSTQPSPLSICRLKCLSQTTFAVGTIPFMLVAYDPRWHDRFLSVAAEIRAATGEPWEIEHIGSTAVPGLVSKPVIDLAIRVEQLCDVDKHVAALAAVGFVGITGGPRTHRVLVRQSVAGRTHIAHFFDAAQWEACNQRIFRDWLIAHPDDCDRYAQVKLAAAAEARGARDYTARKTAVIQDIVDRARAALSLPQVIAWDK